MADEFLKAKIRELAKKLEQETLLEHELSGFKYRNSPDHREIWKQSAIHRVKPKKKFTYIDYGVETNQSGKFLIENEGADAGVVWRIKAYGKKNYPVGNVESVMKITEHNIAELTRAIKDKAEKGNFGLKLKDLQHNHNVTWVG